MDRPTITNAPGIAWRKRASGWACLWVARGDIATRGYRPVSVRLRIFTAPPDEGEQNYVRGECRLHQDAMLAWANGRTAGVPTFDDTVHSLIVLYRTDPDSRFNKIRHGSAVTYGKYLDGLDREIGHERLSKLTGRDFLRLFNEWSEGGAHIPLAHYRITMVRQILAFGIVMEVYPPDQFDHCRRLKGILDEATFETGTARTEALTLAQAEAAIAKAHETGWHEIALGQALQFDLRIRIKDTAGEWIPVSEPGTSDVLHRGKKWMCGLEWREIGPDLWLTHRISKSIRGRQAVADMRKGKVKRYNLRSYPLIMRELVALEAIDGIPLDRRTGPIIIDHTTGLPFWGDDYSSEWRKIARAAGIPDNVQLRDSRAGGATEAVQATGGNLEGVRKLLGHAQIKTTAQYSRAEDEATEQVAQQVLAFRQRTTDERRE